SGPGAPPPSPGNSAANGKPGVTGIAGVEGPIGVAGVKSAADAAANSGNTIGFVAMIGDDFGQMDAESNKILQKPVAEILDQEEKKYEETRVTSGGALGSTLPIFSRLVNWNRVYLPDKQLEYLALNRRNDRDLHNAVLSWDTFFNTAVSSMVNDATAS